MGLSATIPVKLWNELPQQIGLNSWKEFKESPNMPNIFYDLTEKPASHDIATCVEEVFQFEIKTLKDNPDTYPVTLLYMPLEWCSRAISYATDIFGGTNLYTDTWSCLFADQDLKVREEILSQLKMENPRIRLIFCSSTISMGFDSPCVVVVRHGKPPKNMVDLVQQVGRAGRLGQASKSVVYFNSNDLATNVKGMTDDMRNYCRSGECLRKSILNVFGFKKPDTDNLCECCCICQLTCSCDKCHADYRAEDEANLMYLT